MKRTSMAVFGLLEVGGQRLGSVAALLHLQQLGQSHVLAVDQLVEADFEVRGNGLRLPGGQRFAVFSTSMISIASALGVRGSLRRAGFHFQRFHTFMRLSLKLQPSGIVNNGNLLAPYQLKEFFTDFVSHCGPSFIARPECISDVDFLSYGSRRTKPIVAITVSFPHLMQAFGRIG